MHATNPYAHLQPSTLPQELCEANAKRGAIVSYMLVERPKKHVKGHTLRRGSDDSGSEDGNESQSEKTAVVRYERVVTQLKVLPLGVPQLPLQYRQGGRDVEWQMRGELEGYNSNNKSNSNSNSNSNQNVTVNNNSNLTGDVTTGVSWYDEQNEHEHEHEHEYEHEHAGEPQRDVDGIVPVAPGNTSSTRSRSGRFAKGGRRVKNKNGNGNGNGAKKRPLSSVPAAAATAATTTTNTKNGMVHRLRSQSAGANRNRNHNHNVHVTSDDYQYDDHTGEVTIINAQSAVADAEGERLLLEIQQDNKKYGKWKARGMLGPGHRSTADALNQYSNSNSNSLKQHMSALQYLQQQHANSSGSIRFGDGDGGNSNSNSNNNGQPLHPVGHSGGYAYDMNSMKQQQQVPESLLNNGDFDFGVFGEGDDYVEDDNAQLQLHSLRHSGSSGKINKNNNNGMGLRTSSNDNLFYGGSDDTSSKAHSHSRYSPKHAGHAKKPAWKMTEQEKARRADQRERLLDRRWQQWQGRNYAASVIQRQVRAYLAYRDVGDLRIEVHSVKKLQMATRIRQARIMVSQVRRFKRQRDRSRGALLMQCMGRRWLAYGAVVDLKLEREEKRLHAAATALQARIRRRAAGAIVIRRRAQRRKEQYDRDQEVLLERMTRSATMVQAQWRRKADEEMYPIRLFEEAQRRKRKREQELMARKIQSAGKRMRQKQVAVQTRHDYRIKSALRIKARMQKREEDVAAGLIPADAPVEEDFPEDLDAMDRAVGLDLANKDKGKGKGGLVGLDALIFAGEVVMDADMAMREGSTRGQARAAERRAAERAEQAKAEAEAAEAARLQAIEEKKEQDRKDEAFAERFKFVQGTLRELEMWELKQKAGFLAVSLMVAVEIEAHDGTFFTEEREASREELIMELGKQMCSGDHADLEEFDKVTAEAAKDNVIQKERDDAKAKADAAAEEEKTRREAKAAKDLTNAALMKAVSKIQGKRRRQMERRRRYQNEEQIVRGEIKDKEEALELLTEVEKKRRTLIAQFGSGSGSGGGDGKDGGGGGSNAHSDRMRSNASYRIQRRVKIREEQEQLERAKSHTNADYELRDTNASAANLRNAIEDERAQLVRMNEHLGADVNGLLGRDTRGSAMRDFQEEERVLATTRIQRRVRRLQAKSNWSQLKSGARMMQRLQSSRQTTIDRFVELELQEERKTRLSRAAVKMQARWRGETLRRKAVTARLSQLNDWGEMMACEDTTEGRAGWYREGDECTYFDVDGITGEWVASKDEETGEDRVLTMHEYRKLRRDQEKAKEWGLTNMNVLMAAGQQPKHLKIRGSRSRGQSRGTSGANANATASRGDMDTAGSLGFGLGASHRMESRGGMGSASSGMGGMGGMGSTSRGEMGTRDGVSTAGSMGGWEFGSDTGSFSASRAGTPLAIMNGTIMGTGFGGCGTPPGSASSSSSYGGGGGSRSSRRVTARARSKVTIASRPRPSTRDVRVALANLESEYARVLLPGAEDTIEAEAATKLQCMHRGRLARGEARSRRVSSELMLGFCVPMPDTADCRPGWYQGVDGVYEMRVGAPPGRKWEYVSGPVEEGLWWKTVHIKHIRVRAMGKFKMIRALTMVGGDGSQKGQKDKGKGKGKGKGRAASPSSSYGGDAKDGKLTLTLLDKALSKHEASKIAAVEQEDYLKLLLAVNLVQRCYRRHCASRQVRTLRSRKAAADGAMTTMPGTVEGTSGWYQAGGGVSVPDGSGSGSGRTKATIYKLRVKVAQVTLGGEDSDDEKEHDETQRTWSIMAGPITEDQWRREMYSEMRKQTNGSGVKQTSISNRLKFLDESSNRVHKSARENRKTSFSVREEHRGMTQAQQLAETGRRSKRPTGVDLKSALAAKEAGEHAVTEKEEAELERLKRLAASEENLTDEVLTTVLMLDEKNAVTTLQKMYRGRQGREKARDVKLKEVNSKGEMLSMPGTVMGKSGWYQNAVEVFRFHVTEDGEWEFKEGPIEVAEWRRTIIRRRRDNLTNEDYIKQDEEEAGRKAEEEATAERHRQIASEEMEYVPGTFQMHKKKKSDAQAGLVMIIKLQAIVRRNRARAQISQEMNTQGILMALPGTLQGGSGWYQAGSDAVWFTVTEEGEWTTDESKTAMPVRQWRVKHAPNWAK